MSLQPSWLAVGYHRSAAPCAPVDRAPSRNLRRKLEMRLLTVLEACWAKPMRGFFAASRWLEHLSEYPAPHVLQFIPLLLSFPAAKLFDFCFERRYLLQLRHLRLLGFEEFADSLSEKQLQFTGAIGKNLSVSARNHRWRT
ncbi:MAG: hypothetical protein QOE55_4662 [Acidobacteriaceae bacterium]|jgi:hypothetical protein|nr:hypothetical protein [Acidobacteriaceae bacterium]